MKLIVYIFEEKKFNLKLYDFMIVLQEFEIRQEFRKFQEFQKIMKMVKSAPSSNREKIAFARVGTKPLGGELVLD